MKRLPKLLAAFALLALALPAQAKHVVNTEIPKPLEATATPQTGGGSFQAGNSKYVPRRRK